MGEEEAEEDKASHRKANNFHKTNKRFTRYIKYYLKTKTCKFGTTCKFHHPRDKAGIVGRVPVNIIGLPLRPNEPDCAYYLRTGQCKFGTSCKFHHPQPSNMMV